MMFHECDNCLLATSVGDEQLYRLGLYPVRCQHCGNLNAPGVREVKATNTTTNPQTLTMQHITDALNLIKRQDQFFLGWNSLLGKSSQQKPPFGWGSPSP